MSFPESSSEAGSRCSDSAFPRRSSCASTLDSKRFSSLRPPRRNTFRFSRTFSEPSSRPTNIFCDELVLMIIDYFASSFNDPRSQRVQDRRTLVACSRVSRFWNRTANKQIYQWAELKSFSQCAQFRKTCMRRPHLASMVKVLTLPHTWGSCVFATGARQHKMALANIQLAAELLDSLPNLEIFKLSTTQRVPFTFYASYFDEGISTNPSPFKGLRNLSLSHQACYDFTVRAPLPWHMDFSSLESLSLSRFVIWHDDVWPMTWPHLPSLKHLTLEECFLDGEELAHLLTQVSDSLRTIHLFRSLFSISIMSEGLGVVAETLEELAISEHWGFEDTGATFSHFTALKTLKLESSTCCLSIYSKLPPNIENLQVAAGYSSSRVLEEILGFLETDIKSYLPNFKSLGIKGDLELFESWSDHIKSLCNQQELDVELDLSEQQPFANHPSRTRKNSLLDSFSWTLKGLKALKQFVIPPDAV